MNFVVLHRKKNRVIAMNKDRWKKFLKLIIFISILYMVYVLVNINVANRNIANNIGMNNEDIEKGAK